MPNWRNHPGQPLEPQQMHPMLRFCDAYLAFILELPVKLSLCSVDTYDQHDHAL